jgi:hypothetical protein
LYEAVLHKSEPGGGPCENQFVLGKQKQVSVGVGLELAFLKLGPICDIDEVGKTSRKAISIRSGCNNDAPSAKPLRGLSEEMFRVSDVLDDFAEHDGRKGGAPKGEVLDGGGDPPFDGEAFVFPLRILQKRWTKVESDCTSALFGEGDGDIPLGTGSIQDQAFRGVRLEKVDHHLESSPVGQGPACGNRVVQLHFIVFPEESLVITPQLVEIGKTHWSSLGRAESCLAPFV